VARRSVLRHIREPIPVHKLSLADLQDRGLYWRPTFRREGRLIDGLSIRPDYDGSISTEHANARFCVPQLANEGWALFCDGDVLYRSDVSEVFRGLDERKAVYCVKHWHEPSETEKMDGQLQTRYPRKNWSSFMIFNCEHVSNMQLARIVNERPGRDLHAFCWLEDEEIGALPRKWNHLVGWSDPQIDPAMVHFTSGTPDMPGYENCDYADEWRAEFARRIMPATAE
jgi:lipopolysaccharide biosynthesis glycosyltransferase